MFYHTENDITKTIFFTLYFWERRTSINIAEALVCMCVCGLWSEDGTVVQLDVTTVLQISTAKHKQREQGSHQLDTMNLGRKKGKKYKKIYVIL